MLDEDEAPLGDVDDDEELLGLPAASGAAIDEELDVLPGVVAALPVADELELVSGVVLPDGVVLLVAEVDGVVVVEDEEVAGGFTVTLVDEDVDLSDGVSGALLQAASESADSKASASMEGRFIGDSWSWWWWEAGVARVSHCPRITCPASVGRARKRPYRAPSEPVVGGNRRCRRFLHAAHAKSSAGRARGRRRAEVSD